MMGWFTLRKAARKYESATFDDISWMLSKAAGCGAGFAFNMSRDALNARGKTREYLKLEQSVSMLLLKCIFDGEEPPYLQVKLFVRGEPVFVLLRQS